MGRKRRSRGGSRGEGTNATERVYVRLKRSIQNDALAAGRTYLQPDLARKFGVSRTPAREAIIQLACEQFIEILPRRGILVRPITIRELGELCELLAVLEGLAARRVATLGASERLILRLEAAHDDMTAAVADGDLRRWTKCDEIFHGELVSGAGNAELGRLVATIWDRLKRVRNKTTKLRGPPTQSNLDHQNLLSAIRRRNPDRAFAVQERHHLRSAKMIKGLLGEHGIEEI